MEKLIYIFCLLTFTLGYSQNKKTYKPNSKGVITNVTYVPSIAEQIKNGTFIPALPSNKGGRPKMRNANKTVIGKGFPKGIDELKNIQDNVTKRIGVNPFFTFEADITNPAGVTDPTGAAGSNHYIGGWNSSFRIFDKSGNPLIAEASFSTIFPGNDIGDPIILYDAMADRFILTEFDNNPNGFNVAICTGSDPINDGWHVYTTGFGTGNFPDYTKFSIWPDGYYVTANIGSTNNVFVVEREQMLNGNTARFLSFPLTGLVRGGFYSPQVFNVGNATTPNTADATVVFMQDDAWSGVTQDHLKLWNIKVDWNNLNNSTISAPTQINTTAFTSVFDGGSFSNLEQPFGGGLVDAMQSIISNQAQFRKFPTHNSAVFSFVVDTDASVSNKLAGIRWYELRQASEGQPWSIFQEGTYNAPDEKHAWAASMAMDALGNIGMGYTSMGGTVNQRIGISYTGRLVCDTPNTMPIDETVMIVSSNNCPGNRYADYTHLTIDPSDDKTFYYISEYFNPGRRNVVGVFKIANDNLNDVGVISIDSPNSGALGANETVIVSVSNYGINTQSNIPMQLTVDGTIYPGTLVGPIATCEVLQYSFTGIDLSNAGTTYTVEACTVLINDDFNNNNCITKQISSLNGNDIGVIAITNPVSGASLGTEAITVTIENFGGTTQSNFGVSYSLNGNTPVSETVTGPLQSGQTMDYTFTNLGDFSSFITHNLLATTNLSGDVDTNNDPLTVDIVNVSCIELNNNNTQIVGPNSGTVTTSIINIPTDFPINDVNITLDIEHTFDDDLSIKLISPNGTEVVLTENQGGSGDNYTNTLFDDDATLNITTGSAPFTGTFSPIGSLADFNGEQSIGDWTLQITDNTNGDQGVLNNWILQICGDLTADIEDEILNDSGLIVTHDNNNHYQFSLPTTTLDRRLTFSVTNMIGQTLVSNQLENENGQYQYDLDMSYATPGVYIINLGDNKFKRSRKIIIK